MFEIKSERLNLDGEFETAFAVFGKGDESQCIFGGSFDDADDLMNLLSGVARLLPRIADIVDMPVVRLVELLLLLSYAKPGETEVDMDEFADADAASAVSELCDELGVEMPR